MLLARYMADPHQAISPTARVQSDDQVSCGQQELMSNSSGRARRTSSSGLAPRHETPAEEGSESISDGGEPSMVNAVSSVAKMTVGGMATGVIEVGEATPIVAPIFVALKLAKDLFDKVKRNKKQLEELHDRCTVMTTYVIIRCNTKSSNIDVTPLMDCVDDLKALTKSYSVRGTFSKITRCRRDGNRIQRLRDRIEGLVPTLELAAVIRVSEQVSEVQTNVKRLCGEVGAALEQQTALVKGRLNEQTTLLNRVLKRQASMMKILGRATNSFRDFVQPSTGAPRAETWHIARVAVIDEVYECFDAEDAPWLAGLVGGSGSGKSTVAAMIAGGDLNWTGVTDGRLHDNAVEGLVQLRALFPDGIIWLRIGRGATERLPSLMEDLASRVYDDVGNSIGYAPGDHPSDPRNGTSYVSRRLSSGTKGKSLRCLLVADDVWESEVLDELRKTGMRVLVTSRDPALVERAGGAVVGVDRLSKEEAERLLRAAADLSPRARLPDAAYTVMERCDRVAMYLESVGRWSTVRGRSDSKSWAKAAAAIDKHRAKIRRESSPEDVEGVTTNTRVAILRAGFDCLGAEDGMSRWLYLALAVMPDGHAFEVYEAAVLMHGPNHTERDLELAGEAIASLERWAIVSVAGADLYRMHDARAEFARRLLRERGHVRTVAVRHWCAHLSSLEVVQSVDVFALVGLWQALQRVAGDDCVVTRPYDAALAKIDVSDPFSLSAAQAVALLYHAEGDDEGAEKVMQKVWERHESSPGADPRVGVSALWYCAQGAKQRREVAEERRLLRRMDAMLADATRDWKHAGDDEGIFAHHLGLCYQSLRRMDAAECWFQKARSAQEVAKLGADHPHVAFTLHGLAQCARRAGRVHEAEDMFRQALKIKETRLGARALQVGSTLRELGNCVRVDFERLMEAQLLLSRALGIYEAKLGARDPNVSATKRDLAACKRSRVTRQVLRTSRNAAKVAGVCLFSRRARRVWLTLLPAAVVGGIVLARKRGK